MVFIIRKKKIVGIIPNKVELDSRRSVTFSKHMSHYQENLWKTISISTKCSQWAWHFFSSEFRFMQCFRTFIITNAFLENLCSSYVLQPLHTPLKYQIRFEWSHIVEEFSIIMFLFAVFQNVVRSDRKLVNVLIFNG